MPELMAGIRALGFDLDGTLIDTAPDLTDAINTMLEVIGQRPLTEACIRRLIGKGVEHLVLRSLTASLGHEPSNAAYLANALAQFRATYGQHFFRRSQVYPGALIALQSLTQAAMPLCCVTNKESTLALPLLEAAGIGRYLAFTLCPEQPPERKPSPTLLLAACARLCVKPHEMLYVGDSVIDIRAARAAGCRVAAVNYGYDDAHFDAKADAVIGSLTELVITSTASARVT
jgi:phosphoglycolate phosphatase